MQKVINTEAIQSALAKSGMNQKQLADTIGVSSQAVTNWIKGKDFPRPATLLKLAQTLALTFDEMVKADTSGAPIVAFRKKGNAKTTEAHISHAREIGFLLKPLVEYLPDIQSLRTLITSPSMDYSKLQTAVSQTRSRLGVADRALLKYEQLIGEFKNCGAVLIPVLWGDKGNHENAMHIRLPQEDVTFIFLNLDTRLEDFKFWMAHELAHVYTPELAGKNEGEDFADLFAGALLFPKILAAEAYVKASSQPNEDGIIRVLRHYAHEHEISLNTVFQHIKLFAHAVGLAPLALEDSIIHRVRNSNVGQRVSEALFDAGTPEPTLYLAATEHLFQSDFFKALKQMIHAKNTGASYIQQILKMSTLGAVALHQELQA